MEEITINNIIELLNEGKGDYVYNYFKNKKYDKNIAEVLRHRPLMCLKYGLELQNIRGIVSLKHLFKKDVANGIAVPETEIPENLIILDLSYMMLGLIPDSISNIRTLKTLKFDINLYNFKALQILKL